MADDLFRVFKSVRKLVREKTEDLLGNISPLERTLRDVVDEDSCAVSNSLLRHIAVTTNDAYAYSVVAQAVWQGISSEFWQRIYKCLCLLEYMILLGPERCRHDCAEGQMTIRSLTQYRYHDGRREQGGGVRQKAENILKLINDAEYWKQMKEQAIQDNEKYAGGIENEPYISPISHMNLHTRASNPFFTGPQAMPPAAFVLRDSNPFGQSAAGFGQSPAATTFGGGRSAAAGPPFFNRPSGISPMGGGNPFIAGLTPTSRMGNPPPFSSSGGGGGGPGAGGTFGLYDPGDDFATDDPFANANQDFESGAKPPDQKSAPPVDSDKRDTGPQPVASSLLDDDLFESSCPAPAQSNTSSGHTSGQSQNVTNVLTKPAAAALLPDLLD